MKIEMGESLMMSWLKHIKKCQITTLNWKVSNCWEKHNIQEIDKLIENMKKNFSIEIFGKTTRVKQIISQAELDVLGINIDNNTLQNIYAIDVAFHENGLLYTHKDNLHKITEKLLRSALILYSIFNVKTGNIIFATPKAQPKDVDILQKRTAEIEQFMKNEGFDFRFSFICNADFYNQILLPVQEVSKNNSDTSELFMRCLQMMSLFKKNDSGTASGNRQSGTTTNYENNVNKIPVELTTDENEIFVTQNIESSSLTANNKMTKSVAKKLFEIDGVKIGSNYTFASSCNNPKGIFWANPDGDFLQKDWDIILNDTDRHYLYLFHIPANTYSIKDFEVRVDKSNILQLYIDTGSFIETHKNVDLKKHLICTKKYNKNV